MLYLILATAPGSTTTVCLCPGHTHGIGITCAACSLKAKSLQAILLPPPLSLQMSTHYCMMVMFSLSVPMQAVGLSHAQTELEAVLLLPCPSSCSTISLLGGNYRFFSKRISSCLPHISWLVIEAAGLTGKAFLIHHSLVLGLAGGAMGSTDSSIPHSPILDAFTCQDQGVLIRGNRSQDASPTSGSWQKVWAQLNSTPQSHPLETLQCIHHTNGSWCLPWWPPTILGHGAGKEQFWSSILEEESPLLQALALHYSLSIAPLMLCALVFPRLCSHMFPFGWVGIKRGLDSWRLSQSDLLAGSVSKRNTQPVWNGLLH